MSENGPTITVTRGKRTEQAGPKPSASPTRSQSSGWGLSGIGALVSGVVRGARAAWWAGLGVVATAQDAGTQVFDALVDEGRSWEQARRERTEATARRVRAMTKEGDVLRATEERVQSEVNEMLRRVGVPTRNEVQELREGIGALADRVERLARLAEENDG
ncbi:phasin family protein [Salinibacter altiplanensis]|uniref:phasin family protein n=1 Tax=Salinibacter altiplanensis TaxID=1803181 RepID=UPI000C9EDCF1|nr:phasin family protein [Salinibacter altiplanensis]